MKRIYAGSFGAFRLINNECRHSSHPISVIADATHREIEDHGLDLANFMFPEYQGFYDHYSLFVEITDKQIQEYIGQFS